MQTITTQYAGPTNTKGSRVMVKSWLKNKAVSWDCSQSSQDNHLDAAQKLVDELNKDRQQVEWMKDMFWTIIAGGSMPDGKGYAYIIDLKAI